MTRLETDVLVIGGGGAATASALRAHESGARVLLAVKGRFGLPGVRGAGATSNPMADFWTIRTVGADGGFLNPPDRVHADMIQAGLGMADPRLCRVFVDEVGDAIRRLREAGLRFQSRVLATMPADPGSGGTHGIVAVQKAMIQGTDIQVQEGANVTDVVVQGGRCLGAIGLRDDGEPFLIEAGAVILATGGVGQLFRYSFNPPGNTGDGYAIALRAGAELFNMEFMQQGLATTWPRPLMVMLYEMEEPYRLRNREGGAFVAGYLPEGASLQEVCAQKATHWPVSCRDQTIHLDRAIKGEVLAGRGTEHDAVLLDLSSGRRGFQPEVFERFMASHGVHLDRDLLHVQLFHHTSNGGVRIDADGHSRVPGLFAVGEVAGWQGADRLGGTMLGGSQVFGWRAGARAAQVASTRPAVRLPDDACDPVRAAVAAWRGGGGRHSPEELRRSLQRTMWETLLVEKDARSLEAARRCIGEHRERLADVRIDSPLDWALAFEHRNLLDVAEAIIEAARLRTESRGSHYRSDHPARDDEHWLTNILIRRGRDLELERRWIAADEGWTDRPGDIRIKPWG